LGDKTWGWDVLGWVGVEVIGLGVGVVGIGVAVEVSRCNLEKYQN